MRELYHCITCPTASSADHCKSVVTVYRIASLLWLLSLSKPTSIHYSLPFVAHWTLRVGEINRKTIWVKAQAALLWKGAMLRLVTNTTSGERLILFHGIRGLSLRNLMALCSCKERHLQCKWRHQHQLRVSVLHLPATIRWCRMATSTRMATITLGEDIR